MTPKERKYNFVKAITDKYGFSTIITRKQINEVFETSPDQFSNPLLMEKELRVDRGEYKTPKNLDKYSGFMIPVTSQPKRTVKDVLDILSSTSDVDSNDDSYYNDYRNEDDDINEIVRML